MPSVRLHDLRDCHPWWHPAAGPVVLQGPTKRPELNGRSGEVLHLIVGTDGAERAVVRLYGDGSRVSVNKRALCVNAGVPEPMPRLPWSIVQEQREFFRKWHREISRQDPSNWADGQHIYD